MNTRTASLPHRSARLVLAAAAWIATASLLVVAANDTESVARAAAGNRGAEHQRNGQTGPRFRISMAVQGTNGYKVEIVASDSGVLLSATRGNLAAVYLSKTGRASTRSIKAKFGRLGEVVGKFRISDRDLPSGDSCPGSRGSSERAGVFTGVIRFTGEESFTAVRRGRAGGRIALGRSAACAAGGQALSPGADRARNVPERPLLRVLTVKEDGITRFHAGKTALVQAQALARAGLDVHLPKLGAERTGFSAEITQQRPAMQILRIAVAADRRGFSVDPSLTSATVDPPLPFSGTGRFQRCLAPTWQGSLSVSFPGQAGVRLAAPSDRRQLDIARLAPGTGCPGS
jgi:hypothetical protein